MNITGQHKGFRVMSRRPRHVQMFVHKRKDETLALSPYVIDIKDKRVMVPTHHKRFNAWLIKHPALLAA